MGHMYLENSIGTVYNSDTNTHRDQPSHSEHNTTTYGEFARQHVTEEYSDDVRVYARVRLVVHILHELKQVWYKLSLILDPISDERSLPVVSLLLCGLD